MIREVAVRGGGVGLLLPGVDLSLECAYFVLELSVFFFNLLKVIEDVVEASAIFLKGLEEGRRRWLDVEGRSRDGTAVERSLC